MFIFNTTKVDMKFMDEVVMGHILPKLQTEYRKVWPLIKTQPICSNIGLTGE